MGNTQLISVVISNKLKYPQMCKIILHINVIYIDLKG